MPVAARHFDAVYSTLMMPRVAHITTALAAISAGPASAFAQEAAEGAPAEVLPTPLDTLLEMFWAAWHFEFITIGDHPLTIETVVGALALFALGFILSGRLSRLLARFLTRQVGMDTGVAASIQGLVFYALIALFLLLALKTMNVPLTAFTVVGGALAIGVGFGSQNIVNNFISGLILMMERPIRVGDIVDVDGTYGRVERIGARSTWIRTFDNIHIIVPNSSFLEKNVINWTHSDNVIRTQVEVGVAYGSPTREVDRLIQHALKEHGRILEKPPPTVLFTEFGDNALTFRAYFWLRVPEMMDRRRVESDVRFRIDHLFREAGITIAFPQRDVHLDADSPVPVRIVTEEEPPANEPVPTP